jgi:hypothetical protein
MASLAPSHSHIALEAAIGEAFAKITFHFITKDLLN